MSVFKMSRAEYLVPLLLCLLSRTSGLPRVDPLLVETDVGVIRGVPGPDGDYSMFLGIPFATVDPMNPFGPSTPHEGFEGIFEANDESIVCPQRDEFTDELVGIVDCLRLNVHVPNTNATNPLPVLVFFYGGAFILGHKGSALYGPNYLVRHDIILVMMNYRLGAYGFLCPDIPEVPGNQGFKDQLLALKWIKNNIAAFGGDSEQITIAGESSGAISADFHLYYSPEGLFNKAIYQSGTILSNYAIRDHDLTGPMRIAGNMGFVTDNVYEALEFLRTADPALVTEATDVSDIVAVGCVESEYENVERLVTSHPINTNITKASSTSILMGINSNEMGIIYNMDLDWDRFQLLSELFTFDNNEQREEMLTYVRRYYVGDEDPNNIDVRMQLVNFNADFTYYHPSYRSLDRYLENGATNVYQYMFSYVGNRNFLRRRYNVTNVDGAIHADELGYLFDMFLFPETPTVEDQIMIDKITTLWTNFVKFGNPIPEVTELLPIQWPVATKDNHYYLNIDTELSVDMRPLHERMAFWDIFFALNQQYLMGFQEN